MNLPTAPRRPSRVAAVALLLMLHLGAITLLVRLRTTHDRGHDRPATLLLLTLYKPLPMAQAMPPRPTVAPRPLVAPLPPVDVPAAIGLLDSTPPVASATSGTAASGAALSASGPAKLDLAIPQDFYAHPPKLTPAQEAMQDPRSNRLVLTRQEQMDVNFGVVECIAWQRMPDGSIYRGPGHHQRLQGISTNPFLAHKAGHEDRPEECVR